MKFKKIISLILLICLVLCVHSQNELSILTDLTANSKYVKLNKVGKPYILSLLSGEDIYYPIQIFKVDTLKEIVLPKGITDKGKCAIAFFDKKSIKNRFINESKYILIYHYDSKKRIIFEPSVDLNFYNAKALVNEHQKSGRFNLTTKQGKIEYIIDVSKKIDYDGSSFTKSKFGIDSSYFLPVWKNFIKFGTIYEQNIKLNIALIDANNNGTFNDINTDYLILNNNSDSIYFNPTENSSSKKITIENIIEINDTIKLRISRIDIQGEYMLLEYYRSEKILSTIKPFNKLPIEYFVNSDSVRFDFNSFIKKGKYIYVNFLTEYCLPCIKKIPELELISKEYHDKLTTISLLDNGSLSILKNIVIRYNIKSIYGLSRKELNYKFNLNGYPYGILFDENGTLIKEIRFMDELKSFLLKNEK